MNSSMYTIVTVLAVVAFVVAVVRVATHDWADAVGFFGASVLLVGVLLNIAALRHVDVSGGVHSWATLPSWAYDAPVWIGAALLAIAGLGRLASLRKKKGKQPSSSFSVKENEMAR